MRCGMTAKPGGIVALRDGVVKTSRWKSSYVARAGVIDVHHNVDLKARK